MADLNTRSLDELAIVEEIGKNDKVLIESNGSMKRLSGASFISNVYVLDMRNNGHRIADTTIYNNLLQTLDIGGTVYTLFYSPMHGNEYALLGDIYYYTDPYEITDNYNIYVSPLGGEVYQPVNLFPNVRP